MHFLAKGFALLLSISAHAALAIAALHGVSRRPALVEALNQPLLDIAELEVVAPEPLLSPTTSTDLPAPEHHHHPYPVPKGHDATAHDPALQHSLAPSTPRTLPATVGATNGLPAPTNDAPASSEPPASTAPRFMISVVSATRATGSAAESGGGAEGPGGAGDDAPLSEAAVDVRAALLVGSPPNYTAEAEAAAVEANLPLEIVVDANGAVVSARALVHLGYGLDEAALRAVRSYRFSPARHAAKPHSVRMRWVMRFQLR